MPKTNLKKTISGDKLKNDLKTPTYLLQYIEREFGYFFDPCPYGGLQKALENPELDGLKREWAALNFGNPPFNAIKKWLRKGDRRVQEGQKECVSHYGQDFV